MLDDHDTQYQIDTDWSDTCGPYNQDASYIGDDHTVGTVCVSNSQVRSEEQNRSETDTVVPSTSTCSGRDGHTVGTVCVSNSQVRSEEWKRSNTGTEHNTTGTEPKRSNTGTEHITTGTEPRREWKRSNTGTEHNTTGTEPKRSNTGTEHITTGTEPRRDLTLTKVLSNSIQHSVNKLQSKSLVLFVLENALYLTMSQGMYLKDPNVHSREKQLLKRELGTEMNSILSGIQRYIRRDGPQSPASSTQISPRSQSPAGATLSRSISQTFLSNQDHAIFRLVQEFSKQVLR